MKTRDCLKYFVRDCSILNELRFKSYIFESAKLPALRADVATRPACLRGRVPTCPACLRAHLPTSPACSRAHMLICLTCSLANVLCVPVSHVL